MPKKPKSSTVLVIEDDADIRNFTSRVLELEGCAVFQAETSEAGLRLIKKHDISLVMLDLRLPGENGWTLLEKMKGDENTSAIPVIVFTASVAASQRQRALDMGAAGYLVKPLSASILRDTVQRILRRGT